MARQAVALAAVAFIVAGCLNPSLIPTVAAPSGTAIPVVSGMSEESSLPDWIAAVNWTGLRGALDLPALEAGAPCPVTPVWTEDMPGVGDVLGDGPVWPWGTGHVALSDLFHIGDRYRLKVLWIVDFRVYDGPVLIRGQRIGGPPDGLVFYGRDQDATPELRLGLEGWVSGGTGLREFNAGTGFPGTGCFAYQIDGTNLSEVVVAEVTD